MPQPREIGTGYRKALKRLRDCCARVDGLYGVGSVAVSDCELIYESAFLNAVARFEGLLNDLLEEFVCGRASGKVGCFTLVSPRSRSTFRKLATGGRAYVELMPFKTCIEVSGRFLNDSKPFRDIDPGDQDLLHKAVLIRNAIAHRSDVALLKFRRDVTGVTGLPAHRRFPGPYLRRNYRAAPVQTWNDLYLDTLEKVGLQLAHAW